MACIDACYFRALSKRELSALTNGKREHLALLKQRLTKKKPPARLDGTAYHAHAKCDAVCRAALCG